MRVPVIVGHEYIEPLFGFPQGEAASSLGPLVTAFKKICRQLGFPRWPYVRPSQKNKAKQATTSWTDDDELKVAEPAPCAPYSVVYGEARLPVVTGGHKKAGNAPGEGVAAYMCRGSPVISTSSTNAYITSESIVHGNQGAIGATAACHCDVYHFRQNTSAFTPHWSYGAACFPTFQHQLATPSVMETEAQTQVASFWKERVTQQNSQDSSMYSSDDLGWLIGENYDKEKEAEEKSEIQHEIQKLVQPHVAAVQL